VADHDDHLPDHLPTDGHNHDGDYGIIWLRRYGRFHDHAIVFIHIRSATFDRPGTSATYRALHPRPDNTRDDNS
jgi:hypothetical protein